VPEVALILGGQILVARKRQAGERKLRTREHVLADLGINCVERQILLRGFAVNRIEKDYGLDLMMLTYNDQGEIENGHVFFQVKATDSVMVLQDGVTLSCRVEVADIKWWQDELAPVILVVYDGQEDQAFWLYVQQYLDEKRVSAEDLAREQDWVTLRLSVKNRLDSNAVERFRQFRQRALDQVKGTLKHGS
jgi:Domain of unknown function (DUF4365)